MKITKAITETLDNITLEDLKNGFLKEREAQQQP